MERDKALKKRRKAPKIRRVLMAFQICTVLLMLVYHSDMVTRAELLLAGVLILVTYLSISTISWMSTGDAYLFSLASMIFTIGETMIYRMDQNLGIRQLKIYLISLLVYFLIYIVYKRSRQFWEGKTKLYLGICLFFFLMTLAFGKVSGGAKNWVELSHFQFQPSEFAKIPFVFLLASWFQNYEEYQKNKLTKYSLSLAVIILIGLFFAQRELGTAVVFFMAFLVCQFAFEQNNWVLWLNLGLALVGILLGYKFFPHVQDRFAIWKNPWTDANRKGFQIVQSLFAIAEGRFFGTGLGLGQPERIPLGSSDFIFASIIEEMGSFMGICLIFLFVIFLYRGIKIAMKQAQDFYVVLAVSISVLFASQAFIMFAGVMKVIPMTGITIPFLTYGGSSLMSSFILLAILQVASEDFNYKGHGKPSLKGRPVYVSDRRRTGDVFGGVDWDAYTDDYDDAEYYGN